MSYFVLLHILPVTPSLLPSNQNSSMTLSTSMTSPVKRGNSSETLGRNSNTVRTTDPASITHYLQSKTDKNMSPTQILAKVYRFKSVLAQNVFFNSQSSQKSRWEHKKATLKGNGKWTKKRKKRPCPRRIPLPHLHPSHVYLLSQKKTGVRHLWELLFSCA